MDATGINLAPPKNQFFYQALNIQIIIFPHLNAYFLHFQPEEMVGQQTVIWKGQEKKITSNRPWASLLPLLSNRDRSPEDSLGVKTFTFQGTDLAWNKAHQAPPGVMLRVQTKPKAQLDVASKQLHANTNFYLLYSVRATER